MRAEDKRALQTCLRELDRAAVSMARVFVDSGADDDLRTFVKEQWLRLAKIQVDVEERAAPAPSSAEEPNHGKLDRGGGKQ
jgi:hypothetical protein